MCLRVVSATLVLPQAGMARGVPRRMDNDNAAAKRQHLSVVRNAVHWCCWRVLQRVLKCVPPLWRHVIW